MCDYGLVCGCVCACGSYYWALIIRTNITLCYYSAICVLLVMGMRWWGYNRGDKTMENKIKIIETGYYHPSNANWSYHIFMVVDETGARLYRSTFGGDKRIKLAESKLDYLSAGKGSGVEYKWKDIKDLFDIEQYTGINWGAGCLE